MSNLKRLMYATTFVSSLAYGDAAIYRDGVLLVPAVVLLGGGDVEYFADVRLEQINGQEFRVNAGSPRTLATIDSKSIVILETFPISVSLKLAGVFSDPCVTLEPVSVTREGNVFQVVVAEAPPNPAALCLAAVVPFEKSIPLDVTGLLAGNYQVYVNGDMIDFDID